APAVEDSCRLVAHVAYCCREQVRGIIDPWSILDKCDNTVTDREAVLPLVLHDARGQGDVLLVEIAPTPLQCCDLSSSLAGANEQAQNAGIRVCSAKSGPDDLG